MPSLKTYDNPQSTGQYESNELKIHEPQINRDTRIEKCIPSQKYKRKYKLVSPSTLSNMHTENDEEYEQQEEYLRNLKIYGYLIIITTWCVFVVTIGTIFNLWQWCFKINPKYIDMLKSTSWVNFILEDINQQNVNVVDNYYILLFILTFVILWIWAVDSWISMKLFRHSKGGGS
ncbi:hypothetical protein C6P40_001484 [Pichia californica]|uniref:Uncharacterized protein n=1 Tax=Pichia californica TaxID=460514 RepID=A0A9P7BFN1_9ASCO|nr:hypothetical protein C6P42_002989 [[Candida] californica]KAG0690752.1 hypothetical protein C6P40_001484 [[Candida] californica]